MLGVEKVTLLYTLLTALAIVLLWPRMTAPLPLLEGRAFVVAGIAVTMGVYAAVPCRATLLLRYLYPLFLLAYWYPDTYEFCQLFPNRDYLFAGIDQWIFGYQPSLHFSAALPQKVWSELFNMGYFAYYPMILVTVLVPLFTGSGRFGRTAFVVLTSFFLYYAIYLVLPVAGPQYYFKAIGTAVADSGVFPHIGDYFRTHTDMLPAPGPEGFFRSLVESAQESGERPTAAFPSSHVGMSTVLMLLLRREQRTVMWVLLPFYLLLCGATVYIEAHYFIDVVGGLLTAVAFYHLTLRLYPRMEKIRL
jgi:membrane-associated phospholipid phosphatase